MRAAVRAAISWGIFISAALFCGVPAPAMAQQGIDCAQAHSAQEKAICASPTLVSLDREVALAYAETAARQPGQSAQVRQDQIAWLRQRDAACADPAQMTVCLTRQLTDRLAALRLPGSANPANSANPATPPAPAGPQAIPIQPATLPPDPAIPANGYPPPAAGHLDAASLPATEQTETLLHVTSPGRFAIAAHSPSGASLQLVDMMTGPSDVTGAAGSLDGRIDQLLDVGVYKLRVSSAKGATGTVALALTAFHDAAPVAALPQPGRLVQATLADGEQRGYWLSVPASLNGAPNIRIEAAGRSLADLRLWRDGRELTDLLPAWRRIEPKSGHALTDLRLYGHVEPGTYLVMAYGGPRLPWMDNDAAQPFLLRSGASPALAEGWTGGAVGPFGSEILALPAIRGRLRLDLPAPASATLTSDNDSASIAIKSRTPSASIRTNGNDVVELQAAAGQAYTLRMIEMPTRSELRYEGTYFVAAATLGLGGDEPPPAVMLERYDIPGKVPKPPAIVADTLPDFTDGWHAKFNLHGATSLPFQSKSGGEVAIRSSGIDITTLRGPNDKANLPPGYFSLYLRPKPGVQGIVDLIVATPDQTPALQPPLPADPVLPLGIQTITSGQRLALSGTDGPGIDLGLIARSVPVALAEGPLTVTLKAGAGLSVPVQIAPGGRVAVSEVGAGDIAATATAWPQIIKPKIPDSGQKIIVDIAPADHARTVVLSWRRDSVAPLPIPAPTPADQTVAVQANTASFFDLTRGEKRGFTLTVPQGGLYRIETLGRLHTKGQVSTPFITHLSDADGNGVGLNMLIQSMLRAGRYRVDVSAVGSEGHLGLLASPAPLLNGATLLPGGSVRASLPAGTGVAFPIEVGAQAQRQGQAQTQPQTYRIQVDGLGAAWTGRLEDSEGWPLTRPGLLDGIEQALRPGHYRLVVAPDAVGRKVVARLTPVIKPADIVGHGPHDLPFGAWMSATWREPDGRDQPRTPDSWHFTLAGPAQATLRLSNGMVATLHRADGAGEPVKIISAYKGRVEAGAYVLEASSLGRNDRLGYSVRLDTEELQPGVPRDLRLPATVPFTIAQARVVSLTTFGTTPVRAELRSEDGTVIGRYGARQDDWNIAASRLLPAGRYILNLRPAIPPSGTRVDTPNSPTYGGRTAQPSYGYDNNDDNASNGDGDNNSDAASNDDGNDNDAASNNEDDNDDDAAPQPYTDAQNQQSNQTRRAFDTQPQSNTDNAYTDSNNGSNDGSNDGSDDGSDDSSGKKSIVSLRMALPDALPPQAAPSSATVLSGQGVHVLTLPAPGTSVAYSSQSRKAEVMTLPAPDLNSLWVARAASPASLVLALERQNDDGGWQTVSISEGLAPTVAAPADAQSKPWRIEVWTVDGGPEPIQLAAREIKAAAKKAGDKADGNAASGTLGKVGAQGPGTVTLTPLDGIPGGLAVARVNAGTPGPLQLTQRPDGLLAGGWGGHALTAVDGDTLLLPGQMAWLLAPQAAKLMAQPRPLPVNETVSLSLQAGMTPPLPALQAAKGHVLLWRADSGAGQPGLGADMGVAPLSSLALGLAPPPALTEPAHNAILLRNAAGNDALSLRLTRLEPTLAPAQTLTEALHTVLAPGVALPVTLPPGDKLVTFDLAPGAAGIAGWKTPHARIAWSGASPLTRSMALYGEKLDILLVNTGATPAPVSLSWQTMSDASKAFTEGPGGMAAWQMMSDALRALQRPLTPGASIKRFFGAAGSFEMDVQPLRIQVSCAADSDCHPPKDPTHMRIMVAGDADLTLIGDDGTVRRDGHSLSLNDNFDRGRIIVRHGIGPMALWMEADNRSPWPDVKAETVTAPAHLALSGPAMSLALKQTQPVLLHATTTSPVLIRLKQASGNDAPALFAAGAEFHRMMAAGAAELQLYSPQDGPLSGSIDLTAEPIVPVQEGLGQPVSVAPGGSAVFGFTLSAPATIGVGVRADPDRAEVRLLDASGAVLGVGVAQLRALPAGQYLIEARIKPDAPTTTIRPAVIGITPRGNGPPPDVAAKYLALVGMKLQEEKK